MDAPAEEHPPTLCFCLSSLDFWSRFAPAERRLRQGGGPPQIPGRGGSAAGQRQHQGAAWPPCCVPCLRALPACLLAACLLAACPPGGIVLRVTRALFGLDLPGDLPTSSFRVSRCRLPFFWFYVSSLRFFFYVSSVLRFFRFWSRRRTAAVVAHGSCMFVHHRDHP